MRNFGGRDFFSLCYSGFLHSWEMYVPDLLMASSIDAPPLTLASFPFIGIVMVMVSLAGSFELNLCQISDDWIIP